MTSVVHCKKSPYDFLIDRRTKWGNPFPISKTKNREQVIAEYRKWIITQEDLLSDLYTLKGKTLACWCAPAACHGDVLAELADMIEDGKTCLYRAGGPFVRGWDNFFLRDDTEIRESSGIFEEKEAYSLFRIEPYGRMIVLGGPRKFAIEQAEEYIRKNSHES
jgi:hypothetical protein